MLRRSLSPLLSYALRRAVPAVCASIGASFCISSSSNSSKPCLPGEEETNENNQNSRPTGTITVDRSGLYNPPDHLHKPSLDTGIVKHLKSIIKAEPAEETTALEKDEDA